MPKPSNAASVMYGRARLPGMGIYTGLLQHCDPDLITNAADFDALLVDLLFKINRNASPLMQVKCHLFSLMTGARLSVAASLSRHCSGRQTFFVLH